MFVHIFFSKNHTFPFISVHQHHQVELLCKSSSSGHVTKSAILIGCSSMKNRLEHHKKKSRHVCFRLSKQLFIQTKMLIALNIRFGVNRPLWCSFVTLKLCCMKMRENSSIFILLCTFYVYIMTVCFGELIL